MNKEFEKILDRLDSHIEDAKSEGDFSYIKPFEIAKIAVREAAEEYNDGWIPCSERLPEENKDGWTHLILSIKTGEVIFGFWHNEEMGFCKHFRDGVCRVCGVIAWMPLPEPYKERD